MKAYIVGCRNSFDEGALLAFAHTAKEALKIGRATIVGWFGCDYIDVTAYLIKRADRLFEREADKEKLARDEAHLIESPMVCNGCEQWSNDIGEDGYCEDCREEIEADKDI